MAGTRLCIQLTFLVEFVLLICVASYFGLCRNKDVLCTPLTRQAGRSLLVIPPQWDKQVVQITEAIKNEKDMRQARSMKRYSMHVTLVLEDGSDWNAWADELDEVLHNEFSKHPCLYEPIQTEILLQGDLSKTSRAVVKDDNSTEYQVSSRQVQEWLERRRHHHDPLLLDVVLYVPIQTPLLVKMGDKKPTSALTWEQTTLLTIVEQGDMTVQRAMLYVDTYLQQHCQLSLSSNPSLWWQQLVHDTHERAKHQVLRTLDILQKSSSKVAITNEVAQRWSKSMELVDLGLQHAMKGDYVSALESLDESLAESQSLLTDPSLMEPLDFSYDHYLAILAPLLFPLLLPFLAGLIREVKRYRKLRGI
jgi:hypothetical protein